MKQLAAPLFFSLALTLTSVAGCGGDDDGDGGDTTCGTGTVLMDGECVPDGSVICETGTAFNPDTGKCELDMSGCGAGTVLVDGQCVPEGTDIEVDLEEEPEPNDGFEEGDAIAGMLDLPGVGDDGTVIHGCVTPYRDLDENANPDIDYDMWLVSTDGPAMLAVTADGVQGLSAGFFLIPGEQQRLIDAGWQRFGLNLSGDTSQRQVYLPEAGVYALVMSDSRSLFLSDGAAGSEDTCYYTTISQVALPAPIAGNTDELIEGQVGNDTLFYSFDATQGGLYDVVHDISSAAAFGSIVGTINGDFVGYGEPSFFGPAEVFLGGQTPSDEVIVVVEPVYNYALAPVDFVLLAHPLPVMPLPVAGGSNPVNDTGPDFETFDDMAWAWFDVGANEVVHFDMTFSQPSHLVFVTPDLFTVTVPSFPDQDAPLAGFNGWVRFPAPGRYYAVLMQSGGNDFDVSAQVTRVTPTAIDIDTPITDEPFSDLGATWHTLDTSGETWLGFNAGATGFGGNVVIDTFDMADIGQPDVDFGPTGGFSFNSNGSQTRGQIVFGATGQALVRVTDAADAANGADTYDVSVAERDFSDLGAIDETNPLDVSDEPLPAGAGSQALYFVRGAPGDTMTITVTPTDFNARLQTLDRTEAQLALSNSGGVGEAESLDVPVSAGEWVAFRVTRSAGTGTAFDLSVTATSPVPYTISSGSLNYSDICGPGVDITPGDTDEGLTGAQAIGFDYPLFGFPAGNSVRVSTNGWVAFGAVSNANFINVGIPDAALPNGILAPYWDDLDVTSLCRLNGANRVTFQWEGTRFASTVQIQFQVVIRSSGRIDYIYGPNHQADGASGTVGVENLGGTYGQQMVRDSAGEVPADSSFTLTPQ